jgi:transcriptional regulator with GAF, ATPase, and Fis domain
VEPEIIDQFTDIVLGSHRSRQLAERTLEVVLAMTRGRAGAIFRPHGERVTLFASRGIDQSVLDAVTTIWRSYRAGFEAKQPYHDADQRAKRHQEAVEAGPASVVVVPVFDDDSLVALLYVDSERPNMGTNAELERLGRFARLIARAVRPPDKDADTREVWQEYLERTPVEDMEREKMLLLLERNEWNIARVSRLMGVTRRTLYLRLARYQIPRQKIRKTKPRTRPVTA